MEENWEKKRWKRVSDLRKVSVLNVVGRLTLDAYSLKLTLLPWHVV